MKRFWISVILLIALLVGSFINNIYVKHFCDELNVDLTQAEEYAKNRDWNMASDYIERALAKWESHERYLHILFLHADIDNIFVDFHALLQLATEQESGGEYAAASASLKTRIGLLCEMDQLTWQNIF